MTRRTPPLALAILGPTASGKSALAMQLAERLSGGCEIVSVDSAQVFTHMDVGTAKPSAAERAAVPHHLIDLITPEQRYSAAQFRSDAIAAVAAIHGRGRLPLLVGGTMLYVKALTEGLSDLPQADAALRQAIEDDAAARGWPALHADLAQRDPEAAARLKPTDAQRIQRALEVVRLTGRPLAEAYAQRSAAPLPFRLRLIGLAPSDRAVLHRRIEARFDTMLAHGLVDELAALRERYALHAGLPSMRCVGYRQAWSYLEGAYGHGAAARNELRDRGVFATRQLAKRQLTWMNNSLPGIALVDCLRDDLCEALMADLAA